MKATRSGCLGVALAVLATGCAATYQPQPSRRIALVHTSGRVFVRDGQRFEVGMLGGGAEALVAGNDLALSRARKLRRDSILAGSFYGLGVATFVTGAVFLTGDDERGLSTGLMLGSLAPLIVSGVFFASARRELLNAVNVYNAALEGPADR